MEEDVLKQIYDDYKIKFHNKSCEVNTNYEKLLCFKVKFNILDLHHLLGFHKVSKMRASETILKLEKSILKIENFRNNKYFDEIIPRIRNYYFIEEIFIDFRYKYCILSKDLTKNTMNLSIVFYKEVSDKYVVLGLRKIYSNVYVPVTLHEGRGNFYKSYRQTKIKNINWL